MTSIEPEPIPRPRRSGLALAYELGGLRHLPRTLLSRPSGSCQNSDPVLVIPGFQTGPIATWPMRRYLLRAGLDVEDWGLGRNHGNAWKLVPALIRRLDAQRQDPTDQFALVGWSQGGFNAREVARRRPDLISQVVTLGTPVVGGPKYTLVGATYAGRGYDLDQIEAEVRELEKDPIRVPITAIYSKADRVVAWQACIDQYSPNITHIEVGGSHVGLGLRPGILALVAKQLCQSPTQLAEGDYSDSAPGVP